MAPGCHISTSRACAEPRADPSPPGKRARKDSGMAEGGQDAECLRGRLPQAELAGTAGVAPLEAAARFLPTPHPALRQRGTEMTQQEVAASQSQERTVCRVSRRPAPPPLSRVGPKSSTGCKQLRRLGVKMREGPGPFVISCGLLSHSNLSAQPGFPGVLQCCRGRRGRQGVTWESQRCPAGGTSLTLRACFPTWPVGDGESRVDPHN